MQPFSNVKAKAIVPSNSSKCRMEMVTWLFYSAKIWTSTSPRSPIVDHSYQIGFLGRDCSSGYISLLMYLANNYLFITNRNIDCRANFVCLILRSVFLQKSLLEIQSIINKPIWLVLKGSLFVPLIVFRSYIPCNCNWLDWTTTETLEHKFSKTWWWNPLSAMQIT